MQKLKSTTQDFFYTVYHDDEFQTFNIDDGKLMSWLEGFGLKISWQLNTLSTVRSLKTLTNIKLRANIEHSY